LISASRGDIKLDRERRRRLDDSLNKPDASNITGAHPSSDATQGFWAPEPRGSTPYPEFVQLRRRFPAQPPGKRLQAIYRG